MLEELLKPLTERYKTHWDERARDNHRAYTASHDWESEKEYTESGLRDAELLYEFSGLEGGGESALEIGCGAGRLLPYVAERFDRVLGIDVSAEMIRKARERDAISDYDNIQFLVASGGDGLPLDEKFDFIFSYTVFQHMRRADTVLYLKRTRDLLSDGGVAVYHFPEPFGLRRYLQAYFHFDPPFWDTYHFRYFLPSEIRSISKRNGLLVEDRKALDHYGLYKITKQ